MHRGNIKVFGFHFRRFTDKSLFLTSMEDDSESEFYKTFFGKEAVSLQEAVEYLVNNDYEIISITHPSTLEAYVLAKTKLT